MIHSLHATWLINTCAPCDMTQIYCDTARSFLRTPSMTRTSPIVCVLFDTLCVTWFIHTCDMAHAHVCKTRWRHGQLIPRVPDLRTLHSMYTWHTHIRINKLNCNSTRVQKNYSTYSTDNAHSQNNYYIQHMHYIRTAFAFGFSFNLGVSFTLNLQFQSHWSLFNGTWQKRPRALDHRLRFEERQWHSKYSRLYILMDEWQCSHDVSCGKGT